ncbi:hypothetical protein FDB52_12070 [Clostridium botulinum]|nr:hypothetical protein [Clostridium botulinum]NFN49269.1 hypothetical protein [Clostridium botulinum]
MGHKRTYTFEEYNQLKDEVYRLKNQLLITNDELKNVKHINNILRQYQTEKSYEKIRKIISEEQEKHRIIVKKEYYREIMNIVNAGITDMNLISKAVGKSYATVRRALIDMNMYPIKKENLSNIKLNI